MVNTAFRLFYKKYRDFIVVNKNLLIADTISLFLSSLFAQFYLLFIHEDFITDSILTAVVEYAIDTPIFFFLFWFDYRNDADVKHRLKQALIVFSICDVMYVVIKIFIQYQLLQYGFEAYQAAAISSFTSWVIYLILVNISIKATTIYSKEEIRWYYAIVLAISVANSFIFFSGIEQRAIYDNIIIITSAIIAVGAVGVVLLRQGKAKQDIAISRHVYTFNSLATFLVLWLCGELIWAYYVLGTGNADPFPSEADVFWLIGYAFLAYALYKILYSILRIRTAKTADVKIEESEGYYKGKSQRTSQQLWIVVFSVAAIIGASLSYITLTIFTSPHAEIHEIINAEFAISMAYPVLDGVILVPTVVIIWSLRRVNPVFTHWVLLCCFVVMQVVGDVGFAYSELITTEEEAEQEIWIWDTFFNAAYICMAGALLWYNKFNIVPAIKEIEEEKREREWHRNGNGDTNTNVD